MGSCGIPSGKMFNGGQILSYLEWRKNNPWKRGNEMKVLMKSLAVLKLQVISSLPMEINNCAKPLRDSLWKIQKKTLIKQAIETRKYLSSAQCYLALGRRMAPGEHRSEQQCWPMDREHNYSLQLIF